MIVVGKMMFLGLHFFVSGCPIDCEPKHFLRKCDLVECVLCFFAHFWCWERNFIPFVVGVIDLKIGR